MAIKYLDFSGGNDSNDGSTYALRVKTITSGMTSARHAAGDEIRIMKSEDPVSLGVNATFTNKSPTVTLSSALTATIHDAQTTWTGGDANVTRSTSTTRKFGATSTSLAIAAGFTTGLVAYQTITATNFSAYQKVTFWIRPNAAVAANVLRICLCSDTAGTVIVDDLTIDTALVSAFWSAITLNKGSALGSSIQSVAIYATTDPGTVTLFVNNITATNQLTLSSVIGTSSSSTALEWYPVKSINGTTLTIDMGINQDAATTSRGWPNATTTTALYKIEPINILSTQTVQRAGTISANIIYTGGWDTTNMTTQTGLTFISVPHGSGNILSTATQGYLDFRRIVVVRGGTGFISTNTVSAPNKFDSCAAIDSQSNGFSTLYGCYLNNCYVIATVGDGYTTGRYTRAENCYAYSTNGTGFITWYWLQNCTSKNNGSAAFANIANAIDCTGSDCATFGLSQSASGYNGKAVSCTFSGNTSADLSSVAQTLILADNCTLSSTTSYSASSSGRIQHSRIGGNPAVARIYDNSNSICAEIVSVPVHGTATKSWAHYPQAVHIDKNPMWQQMQPFAVSATGAVTFSIWVQRSSLNVGASVIYRADQASGATSDVSATASAAINTWEQLSITFTPSQAVPITIELLSWQISGAGSVFFGDATVTQA